VLRNINLILQKRSDILTHETRVFFTKYNDPPYVKIEKLAVIVKLANESNIDQIISELKEYIRVNLGTRTKSMSILSVKVCEHWDCVPLKYPLRRINV
jgi:vesicle coat complex subunit